MFLIYFSAIAGKRFFLYFKYMKKEIWKDIVGYEGLYQVSSEGRVKSLVRKGKRQEVILKQHNNGHGYLIVVLTRNSISKTFKVHRLVAQAFIPNPQNYRCIDHINTIRTDNRVENLRWVSHTENSANPITKERVTAAVIKRVGKKVNQYDLEGNLVKTWDTPAKAAKTLGICDGPIRKCCLGKESTYKGFMWKYKEKRAG